MRSIDRAHRGPPRAHRSAAFLVLPMTFAACDAPADAPAGVTVRDSAGIRIVETRLPAEDATFALDEQLVIGDGDGPEPYQLFRVQDAMLLDDGGIVVVNGGTRDARFFDNTGTHVRTVGGPGEGPEEYGYPMRAFMSSSGDVVVQDRIDLVYYRPDGEFERRRSMNWGEWYMSFGAEYFSELGLWLTEDLMAAALYPRRDRPARPGPRFRTPNPWVVMKPDLTVIDTVGTFGGPEQQHVDVGTRVRPAIVPFYRRTHFAVGRDHALILADSEQPEVWRYHPDELKSVIRWSAEPDPVEPHEVEAWLDTRRGFYSDPNRRAENERAWADLDVPEIEPYSHGAFSDRLGRTWVKVEADVAERRGPGVWAIWGPNGAPIGRVSLPTTFKITDADEDFLLGIHRDPETDVQSVRLYRISYTEAAG